jgi:hypothetical protein
MPFVTQALNRPLKRGNSSSASRPLRQTDDPKVGGQFKLQ